MKKGVKEIGRVGKKVSQSFVSRISKKSREKKSFREKGERSQEQGWRANFCRI